MLWDATVCGGKFIVLEGINGAGKSTQARLLAKSLTADSGVAVTLAANPPDSSLGRFVRTYFQRIESIDGLDGLSEVLLVAAGTSDLVARSVSPPLSRGECVVCERFTLSALAYQGALGVETAVIRRVADVAARGVTPHMTILLDLDAESALRRLASGTFLDRMEHRGAAYLERVRNLYLNLIVDVPGATAVIDASGNQADVAAKIRSSILDALGR